MKNPLAISAERRASAVLVRSDERRRALDIAPARLTVAAAIFFVIFGLVLRVIEYARDVPLTLDESFLAVNVLTRTPLQLLDRLDFNQHAPLGFLEVEKLSTILGGSEEYALRVVPFVSALIALILFSRLAARLLDGGAFILAVGFFATSPWLILYAATAKPYATDVAIAVLLYLLSERALRSAQGGDQLLALGAVGAIGLWLSYASAFVLPGIIIALSISQRYRRRMRPLLVLVLVWLGIAIAAYFVEVRRLGSVAQSIGGEKGGLGSSAAGAAASGRIGGVAHFLREASRNLRDLLGIGHLQLGNVDLGDLLFVAVIILIAVGLVAMIRRNLNAAVLLAAPCLVGLGGASLGVYPAFARAFLFAAPTLAIFAAVGLSTAMKLVSARHISVVAVAAIAAATTAGPLSGASTSDSFREWQDLRPVLRELSTAQRPGDSLYVFFEAQYALRYYLTCGCFGPYAAVARGRRLWQTGAGAGGPDQWDPALRSNPPQVYIGTRGGSGIRDEFAQIDRLRPRKRLWILVSDLSDHDQVVMVAHLRTLGAEKQVLPGSGRSGTARAYLFDLSGRQ